MTISWHQLVTNSEHDTMLYCLYFVVKCIKSATEVVDVIPSIKPDWTSYIADDSDGNMTLS